MAPPLIPAKRAAGTPLAPSVEKAYYRKCIQLKRRLNEVEAANEEARIRRVRLDRAIMKMRLERAFLLEQLSKRMEPNVEGSEASGDEGVGTPPADRPHRDKRRRKQSVADAQAPGLPSLRGPQPSFGEEPPLVQREDGSSVRANVFEDGHWFYDARESPTIGSTGHANGKDDQTKINQHNGVVGEGVSAGPAIREGRDGERRVISGNDADTHI